MCHMRALERESGGWEGGGVPFVNTSIVSLFHFNFIFLKFRRTWGGDRGETDSTDSGRFNLKQVFHLGRLEI